MRIILNLAVVVTFLAALLLVGCFTPTTSLFLLQKSSLSREPSQSNPADVKQVSLDPLTARSLNRYGSLIRKYSDRYDMDWKLVLAVIRQESRFRHNAVSHRGAYGLMQLMPETQEELTDKIGVNEATTPWNNIRAGVFHLRSLHRYFDEASGEDRLQLSLAAYNAGLGRIRDAQTVAQYLGHDANSWKDVRDALPLLSKRHYTLHRQIWTGGKPKGGYLRSNRQTVGYVENIMQYYDEYKLALN